MEKTRILVVEDEEIVAADLRSTLRKFGYDVIASVSSGEEALAQVATYQPDLVLMDIILKGKMDGVEAAEQIRTKYNIPVIYLTAYSDETTLHRAKITSPYGYILKPFDNHELAIIVELALYKSLMDSKLRQSEARFQAFMNNSPAASWIMDNEGKMIYLSQPYGRITGIDIEKAIGKSAFELYPTEIAEGLMATVRQVDETGQTIEVVEAFPRPDGTIGFTLSYKFPLPDSGQHLIGGVSMDITERKQEEETLRLLSEAGKLLVSSLDYKSLLQNIAHLLVPTLADWCVIDAIDLEAEDTHSGKLSRLVTVYADPTKEALATELSHFAALQATTPAQQKIMLDFLDAGQPVFMPEVSDEFLVKITENEYRFSLLKQMNMRSCMKIPMVVPNRKVGILSLYYTESGRRYQQKDLTLIEELARRLALAIDNALLYREAKKMIEVQKELDYLKDLFMSVASHELRTPLTVITGYAQTLQKNLLNRWPYDDEQSQQNFLDRNSRAATAIVQQSIRLNNLIGQLLDFSRIQNKKLEMQYTSEVNLTELVQRVVEQQQYVRMEHTLNMAIAATEEPVIGTFDEGRLEQVLNNLIGNAIKYSPSGTTVTVGLNRSLPLGQFQGETPSEEAVIWVKDEGYGIEEEAQANLFDRFYRVRTTKNARVDGLGLGLYISQEFIKQHGGRMWLDSQVGRGSTFYFALPIRKDISSVLGAEGVHVAPSTLPYRSEKV